MRYRTMFKRFDTTALFCAEISRKDFKPCAIHLTRIIENDVFRAEFHHGDYRI